MRHLSPRKRPGRGWHRVLRGPVWPPRICASLGTGLPRAMYVTRQELANARSLPSAAPHDLAGGLRHAGRATWLAWHS